MNPEMFNAEVAHLEKWRLRSPDVGGKVEYRFPSQYLLGSVQVAADRRRSRFQVQGRGPDAEAWEPLGSPSDSIKTALRIATIDNVDELDTRILLENPAFPSTVIWTSESPRTMSFLAPRDRSPDAAGRRIADDVEGVVSALHPHGIEVDCGLGWASGHAPAWRPLTSSGPDQKLH